MMSKKEIRVGDTLPTMNTTEEQAHNIEKAYFNRWAKSYDRSLAQLWLRKNYRLMVETLDPPPSAHILDIGCGTGQLAARLAARVPDGRVLGVDPAEEMIKVARQRTEGMACLVFEVGQSDALPAEDNSFDMALSTISFHHWTHPTESLREIARVLKPGGRLFILDFCRDNPLVKLDDWFWWRIQKSHFGAATSADMRMWFDAAGFQDIRVTKPRWLVMLVQGTKSVV